MIGPELAQCSPLIGPGVPVPEEPFPNVNDTAEQQRRLRVARRFCVFLWSLAAAGLGAAAYYLKDSLPKPRLVFD